MIKLNNNQTYRGQLKCPSSKSYMQRAIAIALLANGETTITNPNTCNDVNAILKIATDLGATVTKSHQEVRISPKQSIKNTELNVGESGLGIRMLTPIASLFSEQIKIVGEGSLKTRPMHTLEKPLKALGVAIQTNNGFLPISVKGPLQGGNVEVDGSLSSQILTGLLIALPKTKQTSILSVENLQSKPYIDMSIEIMADFGVTVAHEQYTKFTITGNQEYKGQYYKIEGDWSGAAFHLVGAAIAGEITMYDINPDSKQADIKILEVLKMAGAEINIEKNQVHVKKQTLNAFQFDATHCPDLFPPLSNLAVACKGTSIINGVERLTHKESNRAQAIQKEWAKLGIKIQIRGNEMHITGGQVNGGVIHSHNDHRIAMMGAIASLIAKAPIHIKNPEAIAKSYPEFYKDFNHLTQKTID